MGGDFGIACAFCSKFILSTHQDGNWRPSPKCLLHFRLILLMLRRMCNFCSFVLGIYKLQFARKEVTGIVGPRSSLFAAELKSPKCARLKCPTNSCRTLVDGNKCRCSPAKRLIHRKYKYARVSLRKQNTNGVVNGYSMRWPQGEVGPTGL